MNCHSQLSAESLTRSAGGLLFVGLQAQSPKVTGDGKMEGVGSGDARLCAGALSIPDANPHITLRDRNFHDCSSPGNEASQAEGRVCGPYSHRGIWERGSASFSGELQFRAACRRQQCLRAG